MTNFRIKICGVRTISDLQACAAAGADAVGLNGFDRSVRFVDPASPHTVKLAEEAKRLGLTVVGVFVNETVERLKTVADRLELDAIQLHGDESIQMATALLQHGVEVIRAVRLPTKSLTISQVTRAVSAWNEIGCDCLIDADAGAAYGGEGRKLDWSVLGDWNQSTDTNWILAGGLNPTNLAEAMHTSAATRVDVASGVEQPKGQKSAALIEQFVEIGLQCLPDRRPHTDRGVDSQA
ncbi:MAG: phosphoribosylanthranilate isomerase [Planctomycetota bacterium]